VVSLKKMNIVGNVPVTNRLPGGTGEVIGEAKVEKLNSGALVFHVNLTGDAADILRRGFSLGDFSIAEEKSDGTG